MAKLENIRRSDLTWFNNLLYEIDSSGWHKELWRFEIDGTPTYGHLIDAWDAIHDDDKEKLDSAVSKINEHWDRFSESKDE